MGNAHNDMPDPQGHSDRLETNPLSRGTNGQDLQVLLRIADELPILISHYDSEMRIRFVNRALAEFFKLPPSSIVGRRAGELMPVLSERITKALTTALGGQRVRFTTSFD